MWKKPLQKRPNIRKTRAFWKWPKLAKSVGYSPCKVVSLSQNLKMRKKCEKWFYDRIGVVLGKKPRQKTLNCKKTRAFWKWPKLAKSMGYSPCKMVSLGQNLKMRERCEKRIYDHIRVVVCKKLRQNTPNCKKKEHFENGQKWSKGWAIALAKWSAWVKN